MSDQSWTITWEQEDVDQYRRTFQEEMLPEAGLADFLKALLAVGAKQITYTLEEE